MWNCIVIVFLVMLGSAWADTVYLELFNNSKCFPSNQVTGNFTLLGTCLNYETTYYSVTDITTSDITYQYNCNEDCTSCLNSNTTSRFWSCYKVQQDLFINAIPPNPDYTTLAVALCSDSTCLTQKYYTTFASGTCLSTSYGYITALGLYNKAIAYGVMCDNTCSSCKLYGTTVSNGCSSVDESGSLYINLIMLRS